jgi:predicted ATPase/signal transduction histidine kinase
MSSDFDALTPLCADERFELLRGHRARSGAPVLVRRARRHPAPPADRAALQREFEIAAGLSSAATLLPRWVDGGSAESAAMLVMEDPGGVLLTQQIATARLSLDEVLALGVQVAACLGELHRRGLVHHGVRPDAVLWRGADLRAWLIDFADAGGSGSAAPAAALASPQRLVYMAPEQTGRIERSADPRSDLYALGIVLYELLAGAPPFRADDTLAQIHWHIAGMPLPPSQVDATLPAVLSELVTKLLAKTPDERYQSAGGLAQDLAVCARQWAARRRIAPFPLGRRDIGERLVISSKLYGREREVHTLLEAFEQAAQGRGGGTLLLVEGYSGIGKTALIQQLVRPIVRQHGNFISGKFDQVVRGVPFGALIQAFRALVRQLLTGSEAQLAAWRDTLSGALGANGGVIAEVMPEIEFIVGPQPAPTALGSTEAQNRFQRVLHNFVAALARPEHPLVLFLDDLQWADAATLGLLEPLLTSPEIGCLMLMGAYRDNELDASPRLARTIAALGTAGVALKRLSLGPLQAPDLTQLVADSLRCSAAQAAPLAQLVLGKTGGNPFFVIQFLKSLEREGHLRFDDEQARWTYRIEAIAGAPLADNVVDLMTRSIGRLSPKSQYALTLAACIGNRFDRQTLAIVSEQSLAATAEDLEQALAEGLIVDAARPFGDRSDRLAGTDPGARSMNAGAGADGDAAYAFLHDRVQQSAYAMIPAERRSMVHLTVGRLLRSRASAEQLDALLFDIVQHLNHGRTLIQAVAERREVAALNLAAGRRAKSSTAHDSALELFLAGIELLDAAAWSQQPELSFELHLEAAESRYLCGQFDAALQALAELEGRARSAIDRARVIRLRSVQYENMARYADSLSSARDGLALFGVAFPDAEEQKVAALEREIAAIDTLRAGRAIAALIELPTMTDAPVRMVMSMLTDIWSAAYILGDPTLARLISATMVRLSLEHGNVEESAYGYVTHAITVGPVRGEYPAAYEFGRLALEVNRHFDDARRRAKIHQQFHAHVNLWCRPLRTCMAYAREACRSGLDSGDFLYAAYGAGTEPWSAIVATQDLAQFVRDYTPSVALIEKLKNRGFADSVRVILNWARALQGRTVAPLSMTDATFDEDDWLRRYRDNPFFSTIHAVARLHIGVLLGTPAQALQAARHAASLVHHTLGTVWPVLHDFWHGLALAGAIDTAAADDRPAWLQAMRQAQAGFEALATHCAENFFCQARLLGAEIARIEGRERDALESYEQAIEFAAAGPLLAYEALGHELLGRWRLQRGQPGLAALNLVQARQCYAQWGALAKVDAMVRQYGGAMLPGDTAPAATAIAGTEPARGSGPAEASVPNGAPAADGSDGLDLFSVLKATQAIAGEVDLATLLGRLMHIAVENAGAERGALVLESDAGPVVHTGAPAGGAPSEGARAEGALPDGVRDEATHGIALEQSDAVPAGIVHYVRRTGEAVVLARAGSDEQHGADPYVLRHRPRSLACLPVQRQGRTIGVLYLEHRRADAVFTPQRLGTLRALATQAAVSLENARLFSGLKQEVAERRLAQERLSGALAEVERLRQDLEAENSYLRRDLIANVSHDLRTPLVSMRGYLELLVAKGEALPAEQRRQYLGIAVRQSEHLSTLIDELFELAKLDFKGMALNREPFPFGELAADVVQKFELAAQQRGVSLRVQAAARLPFVDADVSLMERVLENLIGNALQHTPAEGRVSVRLCADDERLHAEVADSGSGIADAELPFIFDRYYRGAEGRRSASGGAGLGLAITKRILELHGTEIAVQRSPAGGTCFTFSLPLYRAAAAAS